MTYFVGPSRLHGMPAAMILCWLPAFRSVPDNVILVPPDLGPSAGLKEVITGIFPQKKKTGI